MDNEGKVIVAVGLVCSILAGALWLCIYSNRKIYETAIANGYTQVQNIAAYGSHWENARVEAKP